MRTEEVWDFPFPFLESVCERPSELEMLAHLKIYKLKFIEGKEGYINLKTLSWKSRQVLQDHWLAKKRREKVEKGADS